MDEQQNIIIYRTADGRASVALYAKDGKIWLNQQQMAELFATSKQTISYHIINILKEKELSEISVVKEYLTTAADGKNYNVVFYSQALGDITADGVKFNIGLLQRYGALKRVNGRKNSEWEVNPLYLRIS